MPEDQRMLASCLPIAHFFILCRVRQTVKQKEVPVKENALVGRRPLVDKKLLRWFEGFK
jgi:hypothetical protein